MESEYTVSVCPKLHVLHPKLKAKISKVKLKAQILPGKPTN